ncbi:MAG: glycosyltransferase family 9 protein, partial [Alphaproteobacteria bacterium]
GLFLHRRWPVEQFEQFIRAFRAKHPQVKVVLIGGAGDAAYVGSLHAALATDDGVVNLAGKTSMRGLLGLLEHAALLVSNDSGPVHFADGYKTPTVALFGPETPLLYRPLKHDAIVLYASRYCSPCMNVFANKDFKGCRDNLCMKDIPVTQVLEAAESLLDGRAADYVHPGRYVPATPISAP